MASSESPGKNVVSIIFALAIHAGLFSLLVYHIDWVYEQTKPISVIQSTLLDENQVKKEIERFKRHKRAREREEQKRLDAIRKAADDAERKRLEAEKKAKDLEKQRQEELRRAEEERKRLAEQAKRDEEQRLRDLAELERKRKEKEEEIARLEKEKLEQEKLRKKAEQEEEARKKAKQEARKKAEEDEKHRKEQYEKSMEDLLKEEAEQLQAEQMEKQLGEQMASMEVVYISEIKNKINRNWNYLPNMLKKDFECTVEVTQIPGGTVTKTEFKGCSKGSVTPAEARTMENAVRRAEPLPKPPEPSLFKSRFKFLFKTPKKST